MWYSWAFFNKCRNSSVPTIPTIEITKVIINLQNKLQEVQGNIETLTNRISIAQFVDIKSINDEKIINNNNSKNEIIQKQQHSSDIQVIDCTADETPDLPLENINSNHSSRSQSVTVFRTLSDDIEPLISNINQVKNDNYYGLCNQQYSDYSGFWKDQLYTEKQHSQQLLRLISGTKLLKLQSKNGKPYQINVWLESKYLNDENKPIYKICWKKEYVNNDEYNNDKNICIQSPQQKSELNSKLSKPNSLLLTSITNILYGQKTQTFRKSSYIFNEKQKQLSFCLYKWKSIWYMCSMFK